MFKQLNVQQTADLKERVDQMAEIKRAMEFLQVAVKEADDAWGNDHVVYQKAFSAYGRLKKNDPLEAGRVLSGLHQLEGTIRLEQ